MWHFSFAVQVNVEKLQFKAYTLAQLCIDKMQW